MDSIEDHTDETYRRAPLLQGPAQTQGSGNQGRIILTGGVQFQAAAIADVVTVGDLYRQPSGEESPTA